MRPNGIRIGIIVILAIACINDEHLVNISIAIPIVVGKDRAYGHPV